MTLSMHALPPLDCSALLIIDMSNEQVTVGADPVWNIEAVISNILRLSKFFPAERIIDSHLWLSPEDHSTLSSIYPYVGIANTLSAELIPQLSAVQMTFVKKLQYSSFYSSTLKDYLRSKNVKHLYLAGVNTDYCVLMSAIDAFYNGFTTTLVLDACSSFGGPAAHEAGKFTYAKFIRDMGNISNTTELIKKFEELRTNRGQ